LFKIGRETAQHRYSLSALWRIGRQTQFANYGLRRIRRDSRRGVNIPDHCGDRVKSR